MSAGYPGWKEILAPRAATLGMDIDSVVDYPALAQYVVNEAAGNKSLLENDVAWRLKNPPRLQDVHREMANLPINTIWTTNYDSVLENAYAGANPDVKVGERSLLSGVVAARVTIYKMHGTITPHPSDLIITQDDYEHYFMRYPLMCRQFTSDLATKSFLFVGVSFTDPNFRQNISQLRALLRGSTRTHFLIYKTPAPEIARQHELWLSDLARYGIVGVQIHDYSEVPEVFRLIRRKSSPRSILVSGSHDGAEFEGFCTALGRSIAQRAFVLLSGEGRNVTTFVSEGAFNYFIDGGQEYSSLIRLFRIPRFARDNANQRYRLAYRRQLTEGARLAIIIAGQSGTMEEVVLCVDRQMPIVPIKCRGQ